MFYTFMYMQISVKMYMQVTQKLQHPHYIFSKICYHAKKMLYDNL